MKHAHYLLVGLLLIAACKCNNDESKPVPADSILIIPDTLLVYEVNTEAKTIKKFTEVPDSAFTPQRIINGLNEKYNNVQLQLTRQSNDTLYVSVPDNEFLGERMGSTGASAWFHDVILNLGSATGVRYVNIDMEKRSHAMPGVFSKEGLIKQYKEQVDSIPVS